MRWILVGVCALAAIAGCGTAPAAADADAPVPLPVSAPAFDATACWRALPAGIVARCGFVTVPESRSRPDGRKIRLAVMALRPAGVNPPGAPTFLLGGGPGQDVIGLFADLLGYWDGLRTRGYPQAEFEGQLRDWLEFRAAMDTYVDDLRKRELVVFDQRGAGYSEPSLKCHGEPYDDCHARLTRAGIDLSAYNTVENAADVAAIRDALGYDRINLQSGSYGTRLAYEVLRQSGESVRAVVFDSALPPEVNWYVETVKGYARNLDVLFEHCAAQPGCRRSHPQLKAHFYALLKRLDAAPLPAPGGGHFDGADLLELVWNSMYDVGKIRWLPALIDSVYAEDYRLLEKWGGLQGESGETMAWGMNYSVECAEEWSAATRRRMIEAARTLPREIAQDALGQFMHIDDVCRAWGVPTLAAHAALKSDTPALFLSGEFDPATPPRWAAAAAAAGNFARAYVYVFPAMGHTDGFFSPCWTSVQSQFLDDPARAPDTACIAVMPDGQFAGTQ